MLILRLGRYGTPSVSARAEVATPRDGFDVRMEVLDTVRESCATSFCTFPEESINGDSIEVVRQEGASENDHRNQACVGDREERRENAARSEAQELDETHRTIRRGPEVWR
jgi:hypothetical protein